MFGATVCVLVWIPRCPVVRKQEAFEQEGQASVWRHALPTPYSALIFLLWTSEDEDTLSLATASPVNKLARTNLAPSVYLPTSRFFLFAPEKVGTNPPQRRRRKT